LGDSDRLLLACGSRNLKQRHVRCWIIEDQLMTNRAMVY
jgi:hypothetical protein